MQNTADAPAIIEVASSPPDNVSSLAIPSPAGSGAGHIEDWPSSAAGGACAGIGDHTLTWSIPHGSSDLVLLEISLSGRNAAASVRLSFQAPLLPVVASAADSGGGRALFAFTADAALHCVALPAAPDARQDRGNAQQQGTTAASPLRGLLASGLAAVRSIPVTDAAALGTPAVLTAVHGVVCLGGSSGSIRCMPRSCFEASGSSSSEDATTLLHRCCAPLTPLSCRCVCPRCSTALLAASFGWTCGYVDRLIYCSL